MDGLARVLAARVDVVLAGRVFWLLPMTLGRLAICEQHLLASRVTPLDVVLRGLDSVRQRDARATLVATAYQDTWSRKCQHNIVTFAEMHAWLEKSDGLVFAAWLCLRSARGRRLGYGRVLKLLTDATATELDELRRRHALVSGTDIMAELDWKLSVPEEFRAEYELTHKLRRKPKVEAKPAKRGWREVVRDLAAAGGLGGSHVDAWRAIRHWTFYQLRVLTAAAWEVADPGGEVVLDESEAERLRQQIKMANAYRATQLAELVRGL